MHEREIDIKKPKLMVTFPYAYMNGWLHLGHGFSFTKAEFFAWFKTMKGYNVLFPYAFHCTGMPIAAAALKLKEEMTERFTKEQLDKLIADWQAGLLPFDK